MLVLLLAIAFTSLSFQGLTLPVFWEFLLSHPFIAVFFCMELIGYTHVNTSTN